MKNLLIAFISVFFLLTSFHSARAGTQKNCIEMMRIYYLWLDQNKLTRAERQLRVATKVCSPILKSKDRTAKLKLAIETDNNLVSLYGDLMDKGLVPE